MRHTAEHATEPLEGVESIESLENLESLRGDCARMVPHWVVPVVPAAPVPPSLIHGVTVPAASARVIDGMSEYGD
ncbi:hypothetical protein [Streptomyces lasiicapitis]|uniref:hypothetical protein n=1 Tax=Streptomyces lasiicapitis TaxID=1923961 RepID=UPI003681F68C